MIGAWLANDVCFLCKYTKTLGCSLIQMKKSLFLRWVIVLDVATIILYSKKFIKLKHWRLFLSRSFWLRILKIILFKLSESWLSLADYLLILLKIFWILGFKWVRFVDLVYEILVCNFFTLNWWILLKIKIVVVAFSAFKILTSMNINIRGLCLRAILSKEILLILKTIIFSLSL